MKLLLAALMLASLARSAGLEPVKSNGALFSSGGQRLPLRCLELKNLLSLDTGLQEQMLDKAAAAGFNSVGFDAPVFGPGSFCEKLGTLNTAKVEAFKALLARLEARRLYALPLFWNQESVEAFARMGGGPEKFYSGRVQLQWQSWLIKSVAKESGLGGVSPTARLAGALIWRGAWPGPKKRGIEAKDASGAQAFTAPLRAWLLWQLRAFRQAGAFQLSGAGLILKAEIGDKPQPDDPSLLASGELPLGAMHEGETQLGDLAELDKLPPLPGAARVTGETEHEDLSVWDLEGLDWDSIGKAMDEIPVSTGLDFMELTLDTEDWYRVGEVMGGMAESSMQVPLLWRHDWRRASRYERQKRLEAPQGLAGLCGPWPDNDWPEPGESIWPPDKKPADLGRALEFKYLEVLSEEGRPVLVLHLNRPGSVSLSWDRRWPLSKKAATKEPALVHKLKLKGAGFGEQVLISAKGESKRWGRAVLRSRWVKLQRPAEKRSPKKPALKGGSAAETRG